MKMIKQFLKLSRPHQWYKNLLVFLALIFSGNLFDLEPLFLTLSAFIILILVSSANYAINDILDFKKDRANPEKRKRPVASGKIRAWQALLFASILVFLSLFFSLIINTGFFYSVLALFLLTLFYSLLLKKIFLLDIIAISMNFVIRAVAGAVVISVFVSPWLVAGVFLFAFFLVAGKRHGEASAKNAERHRKVLKYYTRKFTAALICSLGAILIVAYLFFSLREHFNLIWSSPFFAFLVMRYVQLTKKPEIAANPEKAFSDKWLIAGSIMFITLSLLLLYL